MTRQKEAICQMIRKLKTIQLSGDLGRTLTASRTRTISMGRRWRIPKLSGLKMPIVKVIRKIITKYFLFFPLTKPQPARIKSDRLVFKRRMSGVFDQGDFWYRTSLKKIGCPRWAKRIFSLMARKYPPKGKWILEKLPR